MQQKAVQLFESTCTRSKIYVENEMPIGEFHDFLMKIKGLMVERMIAAHQEQLKQTEEAKALPPHQSEIEALPDQPELPITEQQPACSC